MKILILLSALVILSACSPKKGGSTSTSTDASTETAPVGNASNGVIQLSWAAGTGISTGYYVDQSTDGTNWQQIQNVNTNSTTISGATHGQKYYFRVRAYNSAGNSPYSGIATVTP